MKSTVLEVYGPIEIPHDGLKKGSSKRISRALAKEFWEQEDAQLLTQKQGCYIFSLRVGRGFTPWYVGKAGKTFEQECFTDHKIGHYNEVLWSGIKGTPVMFFVAQPGTKNKVSASIIKELETDLIQNAVHKNPDLCNIKNTKNLPKWGIAGIVRGGQGRNTIASSNFKKMMGI
jgi:hypothetical protein